MKAEYLGHATWLVENAGTKVIFDPWLKGEGNPEATKNAEDIQVEYIFVSHAHDDHAASAVKVAQQNKATIITTFELANHFAKQGVTAHPMHLGGTFKFPFGTVRVTPAFHGSGVPGGHAAGFIVHLGGQTVYHAGDTALFGDMKLLGDLVDIDLALLPIGGNFTMDLGDAVKAVELLRPRFAVPMHYGTFPIIQADPEEFKRRVEAGTDTEVRVVKPGDSLSLEG